MTIEHHLDDPPDTAEKKAFLPPELRQPNQSGVLYPMEGAFYLGQINAAEIGPEGDTDEVKLVVEDALGFLEGLPVERNISPEQLDADPALVRDLYNLFLSTEGSTSRPNNPYLKPAITEALKRPISLGLSLSGPSKGLYERMLQREESREVMAEIRARKLEFTPDEILSEVNKRVDDRLKKAESSREAIPMLRGLEQHVEARIYLDQMFLARQKTCSDPKAAAEIGSLQGLVTLDKTHFVALLQNNPPFGSRVDAVLRFIDDGLLNNPERYTDLDKVGNFKEWIKDLLHKADGDLSAVFAAWKLALIFELPAHHAGQIKKGDKNISLAPPIGNSLINWTQHPTENQHKEYWENPGGERFINKSGHPILIGKIQPLVGSYLHSVRLNRDGQKTNLYEIWKKGLNISDANFPWVTSLIADGGDEPGSGTFDFWYLQRLRAHNIMQVIQMVPDIKKLSDPTLVLGDARLRDMAKSGFGPYKDGKADSSMRGENNPRAWLLLSWIMYFSDENDGIAATVRGKGVPERRFKLFLNKSAGQPIIDIHEGPNRQDKEAFVHVDLILRNFMKFGWINADDSNWIKSYLKKL